MGKDYYIQHILDNKLTVPSDGLISTWVVNGICFLRLYKLTIASGTNNAVVVMDGLPPARQTSRVQFIRGQKSDKTLFYVEFGKFGGVTGDPDDKLYMTTYNMTAGDSIGDVTMCYPIR